MSAMRDVDTVVRDFASYMDAAWAFVTRFEDDDRNGELIRDWRQASWERLVETRLGGKALAIYDDGADVHGESSRVARRSNEIPEIVIVIRPVEGDQALDLLAEQIVDFPAEGIPVERLVSFRKPQPNADPRLTYRGIMFSMSLVDVAESGALSELVRMLDAGASVDERGSDGRTPLHAALSEGHEAVVRVLLEHGADTSIVDGTGAGTVHWAARADQSIVLELATSKCQCDVDATDVDGRTALSWSAQSNAVVSVRWLLEHGADPNHVDKDGWAPLHYAAADGRTEAVALLLASGADPMLRLASDDGELGHLASDLARHYAPTAEDVLAILRAAEAQAVHQA